MKELVHYRVPLKEAAKIITQAVAVRYLMEAEGNLCLAARNAGTHRNTFNRWIPPALRQELRESLTYKQMRTNARAARELLRKTRQAQNAAQGVERANSRNAAVSC